jgi:tRNA (guanine-N7-)-methyltransferase
MSTRIKEPAVDTSHFRGIKSFVNRESKLNPRVQKVWDEVSDDFVISTIDDAVEFITNASETRIVLEIGSGQGNQLIHAASSDSDTLFIGVEVYKTGVAHTLLLGRNAVQQSEDSSESQLLPNFKMLNVDAAQLIERLTNQTREEGLFDEVWTFFPDPWPKKKHNKRRLVQPEFASLVKRTLKSNGVWRLATDWEDYALQMQDVFNCAPVERFDGRLLTNFENKGIKAGRKIYDFCVGRS